MAYLSENLPFAPFLYPGSLGRGRCCLLYTSGISEAPFVIPEIYKRMERMAEDAEFGFLMPEIVPCRFGNKANLYGALYCHLYR